LDFASPFVQNLKLTSIIFFPCFASIEAAEFLDLGIEAISSHFGQIITLG
jgi:hypothetical protein